MFAMTVSLSQQLHTAARRYAMEAHARWFAHYTNSGAAARPRSSAAHDIVPRYQVHQAMLWALEAEDVPAELSAARERLAAAIRRAHSVHTDNSRSGAVISAVEEERRSLESFIRSVSPAELSAVEALPYRRVLSADERHQAEQAIRREWGVADGYWYPLDDVRRSDVVAFEASDFHREFGAQRLQTVLRSISAGRVIEVPEFNEYPAFEQDLEVSEFCYTGAEGYWFDAGLEWIVYASHEDSVTLGGVRLLALVQEQWPEWQRHLWRSGSGAL